MSATLIHNECGRVVPELGEQLTSYRRARKVLRLPDAPRGRGATLYVLARRQAGFRRPLQVSVNEMAVESSPAARHPHLQWLRFYLPARALKAGENKIEFWCDADARTAWSLALEDGHRNPQSFLSADAGLTWQNSRMGSHHVQRGEYIVRLRADLAAKPPPIPAFAWEQSEALRLAELRRRVPPDIRRMSDPWQRARALASWTSRRWRYVNTRDGATVYCPWDPWTILAGRHGDLEAARPEMIRMCVQYGVVFVSLCIACGVSARAVICTGSLTGMNGHFVAEVWNESTGHWAMIDPNLDLAFIDDGRPMGMAELYDRRRQLRQLADDGPGTAYHLPRLGRFLEEHVLTGKAFRLSGVWRRNDFLSRPDLTPPAHGQEAFSETDIIWRDRNIRGDELGMFPFVAPDSWFNRPPADVRRIVKRSNHGSRHNRRTV